MKNQAGKQDSAPLSARSGSAIIWILIMVGFFAALSYALTQGTRTGATALSSEQANLKATQLINYGVNLRNAVKTLIISKGCTEYTLNFYSPTPNYNPANSTAPADKSCNVFYSEGAGMRFLTNVIPDNVYKYNTIISSQNQFEGNGTTCTASPFEPCIDLVLFVGDVPLDVCKKINESAGIAQAGKDTPEIADIVYGAGFDGTYGNGNRVGNTGTHSSLNGHSFGCLKETTAQAPGYSSLYPYSFYQVLIAR